MLATQEGRSQGLAILTQLHSSTFAVLQGEDAAEWLGFVKLSLVRGRRTAKSPTDTCQEREPSEPCGTAGGL